MLMEPRPQAARQYHSTQSDFPNGWYLEECHQKAQHFQISEAYAHLVTPIL
jgi:quinol-cytochrome oxidoreductase complex cytochrome b subunit